MSARILWTTFLGLRDYREVWELQKRLVSRRQAGEIPDVLLLCEHPDTITVGRRPGSQRNLLDSARMPVVEIERGGDVTYHGPGQIVGYPILALEGAERDLHKYLRALEEALIRALSRWGISACRREGWTGVWVGERKIASIGIAVKRWVTFHGFALNVTTDLSRFETMNPCGLPAEIMTKVELLIGARAHSLDVPADLCAELATVLGRVPREAPPDVLR